MRPNSQKNILFCLTMVFFCLKNTITAQPYFDLSKSSNRDTILQFLSNDNNIKDEKLPIDSKSLQQYIDNGGYLDSTSLQQFVKKNKFCVLDKKKAKFLYRKNKKWNIYDFNFKKLNEIYYDSICSIKFEPCVEEVLVVSWDIKNNLQDSCGYAQLSRDIILYKKKGADLYFSNFDTLLTLDADSVKLISNANNFYVYFKKNKLGFINAQTLDVSPNQYENFRWLEGKNAFLFYKNTNSIDILLERIDTSKIYLQSYYNVIDFMPALFKYKKILAKNVKYSIYIWSRPEQSYSFFCAFQTTNKQDAFFEIIYNEYGDNCSNLYQEFIKWNISTKNFLNIFNEDYALFIAKKIIENNCIRRLIHQKPKD